VAIVGGPDVDARQDLMERLAAEFEPFALGTTDELGSSFADRSLAYRSYRMSQRVDPVGDVRATWELVRAFRTTRPAVVHTFDTKPGVYGRLAARLAGVPVVVGTLPGLGSLYGESSLRSAVTRLAYQPLQTLACRAADTTIFQNRDDAREFVDRRVVSPAKARVIAGSGVRTDLLRPGAVTPTARAELGLPETSAVVLMISRLLRSKGVLEFAAAAQHARRSRPDVSFVLVGPADAGSPDALTPVELDELRATVGWQGPRSDVPGLLALADVFVFPSYYREGDPRVLLEAASMGLPLVAADAPGSRDVVVDRVTGLLVPPRDASAVAAAVAELLGDAELRAALGAAARAAAVERFSLEHVAAQTGALYRELLAAAGRGRVIRPRGA
jgi:glycosyltransferase involved in cell wall biosynthesis